VSDPVPGQSVEIAVEDLGPGLLRQCLEYWRSRIGGHFAPSWNDVELIDMPMKAIPFVAVVDVSRDPLVFVYRFWGTGHVTAKGIERTGQSVRDHPQGRSVPVFAEYRRVTEEMRPMVFARKLVLPGGKPPIDQTALRLPLTSDGEAVDKIIAVSDWWNAREYWRHLSDGDDAA